MTMTPRAGWTTRSPLLRWSPHERAGAKDIEVALRSGPGSLAEFGEVLGGAGVSVEGGGVFTFDGDAIAHFLVDDADSARRALEAHGIGPVRINDVVATRLAQDVSGQLGAFMRTVADAGVDVLVLYSDHDHRLILIVAPAQHAIASEIASAWEISYGPHGTDRT